MKSNKFLFLLLSFLSFSQESVTTIFEEPEIMKLSFLDSIKASFSNHSTSNCIDVRWLEELSNQKSFDDLYNDVSSLNIDEVVAFDLSSDLLKKRLKKMDDKSPFNIEYNTALENVIKSFLKNRKGGFERLMAISEYYFPMFEDKLAKYNVPLEIKYLAIVESALNPKAKSRVGASGLWQFMYPTGKQFNLEVTSYIDERFDPLQATEAACQYLSSLYQIFGDWSLVLASYNAGPGNVSKAIRRSGGNQNYWNIRKYLPKETANYVPAFLATFYIYEYQKEHGLKPQKAHTTYFETDTIQIKKEMTFKQISDLFDVPEDEISFLNPIYKLNIIPYDEDKPRYLRLSKEKIGVFISNEEKVYAYVAYEKNKLEKDKSTKVISTNNSVFEQNSSESTPTNNPIFHKVKKGESLGLISEKYNVSLTQLKQWNNLRSNTILYGQKLKLYGVSQQNEAKNNTTSATYVVKNGDNLYLIAKKFPGVSVEDLKKWNGISGDSIKPGMTLKIKG